MIYSIYNNFTKLPVILAVVKKCLMTLAKNKNVNKSSA